jgi:hypothetical protein
MNFAVQPSVTKGGHRRADAHRCPQCREETLVLQRRHVSPIRLGPALVTEYYDCDCCDARYQFTPGTNRWRPINQ